MATRGVITITKSPRGVSKQFTKILKDEIQDIVVLWRKKFLQKHFFANASQRYGYAKRSPKYNKRKLKKVGHTRPFVFTGKLRRSLMSTMKVTGSSKGGKGFND